jgi:type IV secretory pathway VirB2 component (pilin)
VQYISQLAGVGLLGSLPGYLAALFALAMHAGPFASLAMQVGPEQAICNMLDAIKGWTSILVIAAAIAIGFALILRGLAPEFSNQFQGAIRSVIVGLIVIAVLPMVATFILTTLGATVHLLA